MSEKPLLPKSLEHDPDGMATYEYIVNNEDHCEGLMALLVENLKRVDSTGQFLASCARYLNATNPELFHKWIPELVEGAIEKDHKRKYIWSLLEAMWGPDYEERSEILQKEDDNFRRIFKRLYPAEAIGNSQTII